MRRVLLLVALLAVLLSGCSTEEKKAEENLIVKTVFNEGSEIPRKYTCDGLNTNPSLHIGGLKSEVKSLAVIVDDPDAPSGVFTHWIAWNIPPVGEIPDEIPREGVVSAPVKMVQGVNDFGRLGYDGPCPPEGQKHRYFFRVYALDTTLDLNPGASREELENAMKGHVIQYGEIVGVYRR
ncbi:YbhB/YbcL family Raf kinase inhibitor-like protein [Geoglobus acetivorans]|uniref:YbhB/YbcL family Raf kinase inhibitor-like protein n=1 Tax=Geoglobus acetivorans TaxID=565033 RepID=A0ABZ3H3P1_GEOAI|nr:YbhB/YbcL family Raf kinase inhibitor-like protein [Geoglobus acetivorans]